MKKDDEGETDVGYAGKTIYINTDVINGEIITEEKGETG